MSETGEAPAFPAHGPSWSAGFPPGLSKLEYFAAHAPDVPEWFTAVHPNHYLPSREEIWLENFYQWRLAYAAEMVKRLAP